MSDDQLTLIPTRLDDDGAAVATHDQLEIHVAGALPGEELRARLVHRSHHRRADGRRDAWAVVEAITRPSPARVPPVCGAYGACGGCTLQHLAVPEQLAWKRARVAEALAGVANLPEVAPTLPSPTSLHYRNQAKYVVARGPGGAIVLGAYAPRSHDVVDLAGCQLLEGPIAPAAATLRALLERHQVVPYDERSRTGQLRYVVMRSSVRGEVLVTLITARADFPAGAAVAAALTSAMPQVVGVVQHVNATPGNALFARDAGANTTLAGRATLPDTIAGVTIELAPAAFVQLNRGVAAAAYGAIRASLQQQLGLAPDARCARIVDVYSGVGAIAFTLADLANEVVAIEENPAATATGAAARAGNAAEVSVVGHVQRLDHLRFVTAEAAAGLATIDQADVVVLNPPRAGASPAVITALTRLRPRMVVYLSCNPTTLARDLTLLAALDPGFVVTRVQPFDMLPHTSHVETFALISRVG